MAFLGKPGLTGAQLIFVVNQHIHLIILISVLASPHAPLSSAVSYCHASDNSLTTCYF